MYPDATEACGELGIGAVGRCLLPCRKGVAEPQMGWNLFVLSAESMEGLKEKALSLLLET